MKSKRCLSFVLVFAMLMSLGITVFADAMPSVGSSEVTPITENEFAALFGSPDASADYSYNISSTNNDSVFRASLSAAITANNREYQFSATGEVDTLELSGGSSILNGPLYGEAVIDGIAYPFTAGFTKAVGENKINVGIAINPTISSSSQVLFAFGERVMADEASIVVTELQSDECNLSVGAKNEASPMDNVVNFVKKGTTTKKLSNVSTVNGQTLTVYYASNAQRVGAQVKTHLSAVKSYYNGVYNTSGSVYVNKIVISVARNSTSETSSIMNIDGTTNGYTGKGNTALKGLIVDLLSAFGVPTSTFESALSRLTGSLTTSITGSKSTVTSNYPITSNTGVLDNSGMTVAFNLRNPDSAHSANYTISSDVQYCAAYNIPLSGATTFYVTANTASMTYALWLPSN